MPRSSKLTGVCWLILVLLFFGNICRGEAEVYQRHSLAARAHSGSSETPELRAEKRRVEDLIADLGSAQFFVRRQAEKQLIGIGADAFDDLRAVEHHLDLEIAARAQFILNSIQINWVRPGDPSQVVKLLSHYGELPVGERRERIELLSVLEQDWGLAALCRISRFDPSPVLARQAALAIMNGSRPLAEGNVGSDEVVLREIGDSLRVPIRWLHVYLAELQDPSSVAARWSHLVDEEVSQFEHDSKETSGEIVFALLRHQLALCKKLEQSESAFSVLERIVSLLSGDDGSSRAALKFSLDWIRDYQQWPVLDLFEDRYSKMLLGDRQLLYLLAAARQKQGRTDQSEDTARQAFAIETDDNDRRSIAALQLLDLGQLAWAEREWRFIIESYPVTAVHSRVARSQLATWCLHDRGEDQEAAQLLGEYCDAMDAKPLVNSTDRIDVRELKAQREYYLACDLQNQGAFAQQRKHLEKAVHFNPRDPDVLIAMYQLEGADEQFRDATKLRIANISQQLLNDIKSLPDENESKPRVYNHWAWLISNTEGDYQKALKFSLRSLQLSPDDPSYLDTLGRCYYAVGDLDNAILYQRQAVELHPQLQTMRRQLEQFESEIAAQKSEKNN